MATLLHMAPIGLDIYEVRAPFHFESACTNVTNPVSGTTACLDTTRGVWLNYDGTGWQSDVARATLIRNVRDYITGGAGTSASPWTGWEASVNAFAVNTEMYFSAGEYTATTALVPKAGWRLRGAGKTATVINWNTSGYWFNYNSTAALADVSLTDMTITVGASGTGGIRVGNTSTVTHPFSENSWRQRWTLHNLHVGGPGAGTAGTIGVSLTQLAQAAISHVTISNFEAALILDRNTMNSLERIRVEAFVFGIQWLKQDAPGHDGSSLLLADILGPTSGTTGYGIHVTAGDVRIFAPYYEFSEPAGVTAKAFVWLDGASDFRSVAGRYDWTAGSGTLTNTFLIENSSGPVKFIGEAGGSASMPAHSIAAPGSLADGRVMFLGCNGFLVTPIPASVFQNDDVVVVDGTRAVPVGTIQPAALTASVNDYNPTDGLVTGYWRINADANPWNITGIVAGQPGQRIILSNAGGGTITLTHEDVASAAANRFIGIAGANVTVAVSTSREILYDATSGRWRVLW